MFHAFFAVEGEDCEMFHLDILNCKVKEAWKEFQTNILPNGGFFMVMNPMGLNPERNRLKKKNPRFFDREEKHI